MTCFSVSRSCITYNSLQNTHALMGFYMEVLMLDSLVYYLFRYVCFIKLYIGTDAWYAG